MSAAILREAASLMRVRAEAVDEPGDEWWNVDSLAEVSNHEDAEHFVAVVREVDALAVADWLDKVARRIGQVAEWVEPATAERVYADAFAVARAYLGRDA